MTDAAELARAVEEALAFVTREPGVLEAEVFAAANDALLTRLNYTSHIPSNGVEEPKSTVSYGLGIRAAFAGPSGPRIGFGSEPSDLSVAGARRALDRAPTSAVARPRGGHAPPPRAPAASAPPRVPRAKPDGPTLTPAFAPAMVEARGARGSGPSAGTRLDHFTDEAGAEAAQHAIAAIGGERVPSGEYTVVFGRQPVADLLNNIVVPACTARAFYSERTPFLGQLGRRVASPELTISDHGALPGLVGSKGITCEGLPTGRTDLIKEGVLVGCLSNWYETQRLINDKALREKLGAAGAEAERALVPRNGFRFGAGGGRQFDAEPGIAASNVIVEGAAPVSLEELLRTVRDGLYVGRIWYTYPINGLRAGDFTCTVVADSYIIRDGRLAAPLKANAIRINENIGKILNSIVGITKDVRGTIVWAADEVVYAPEIAVRGVRVDEIAAFMEELD